jgi:hypothetical protein
MICLIASVIGLENQDAIQNQFDFWLRTYNMQFMNDALDEMKRGKSIAPIFHVTFLTYNPSVCLKMYLAEEEK